MFFDEVRSYWKESFDFFKWQNLRLMILASLNNFRRAAGIFAKELWFFVVILFCLQAFEILNALIFHIKDSWTGVDFLVPIYLNIGSILGFFFFLLAVRPAVERKDGAYFLKYMLRFLGVLFFALALPAYLLPLQVVSILFLVDLPISFSSFFSAIKNGVVFCIYFLPAIVALSVCSLVPWYLFSITLSEHILVASMVKPIALVVALPIASFLFGVVFKALLIAVCVMYYIKVKHAHHRLFFSN